MSTDATNLIFKRQLKRLIGEKSVNSFAKKCGIGESLVRRYLEGALPRVDKLMQIAEANNVSLEWLSTGEEHSKKEPSNAPDLTKNDTRVEDCNGKYETIRISEKLQKTAVVLESETIYRSALAANIDAFHHAVKQEDQVKKNEETLKKQQQTITALEARVASLEKLLASVTAKPGDHPDNKKDQAA